MPQPPSLGQITLNQPLIVWTATAAVWTATAATQRLRYDNAHGILLEPITCVHMHTCNEYAYLIIHTRTCTRTDLHTRTQAHHTCDTEHNIAILFARKKNN